MKKLYALIILAIILSAPLSWAAAPGTCTQAFSEVYSASGPTSLATLTFTCVASADNASFPATATSTVITDQIAGRYLIEARTKPGATAPQALYDIVLNDTDGIDLMGGKLGDRSATVPQAAPPDATAFSASTLVNTGINPNAGTFTVAIVRP